MKTKDQRNCLYRPFAALMDVFGLFLPFTMPLTGVLIMTQSLTPMLTGAILGA
jgi:biotin transport system substrate-specific component